MTLGALWSSPTSAAPFLFSTGDPDGRIATASRPASAGKPGIESADDFVLADAVRITGASFTGLLTGGATTAGIVGVGVEIYRVFPLDSTNPPSGHVPTRVNSPSDVVFRSQSNALQFSASLLSVSFTASNSVVGGIHAFPNQFTGGEGAVGGQEARIAVDLNTPFVLPAGHYFFVPQVEVSGGEFLWLSAPRPLTGGTGPFLPDLQTWIRDDALAPDWLRIGTDITQQTPFNGSFSLSGDTVIFPSKCDAGKLQCIAHAQSCLLHAHAAAEKKGIPVDAAALTKCTDAFDGGTKGAANGCIGKLDGKQNGQKPATLCATTSDPTTLEGTITTFVDGVVSAIDPGPSPPNTCNASKKGCVGKKAACLLKVQETAAKKGLPPDATALQKCRDTFVGCVAKLEAKQNARKPKTVCAVTGDAGTLELAVDAFVDDVVQAVRAGP